MNNLKVSAFDWVFKSLIGLVCWLVLDMHSDLKGVLQEIPVIKTQISFLKDGQLKMRFEALQPAKHEEPITLDSLTKEQ